MNEQQECVVLLAPARPNILRERNAASYNEKPRSVTDNNVPVCTFQVRISNEYPPDAHKSSKKQKLQEDAELEEELEVAPRTHLAG